MSDDTKKKTSLNETDVKSRRGIGRRTFLLGAVGGTTAIAGCVPVGITDSDPVDMVGMGRGGRRTTGITDSDAGFNADPAGNGRGRRVTGITDSDLGLGADQAGNGRGRRACTDADVINADPAGRGRRC